MTRREWVVLILGSLAAGLLGWAATPAEAQTVCGKRRGIVAELSARYGETRRAVGLQAKGRGIVEVWASEKTGSWTILVTNTARQTCILPAGEAFQEERPSRKGEPS